jgi:hypothetical protein
VISKSEEHGLKQELSRIWTFDGIVMDFNDEQFENAKSPIPDNFDPDSNVISTREEQSLKQELSKI